MEQPASRNCSVTREDADVRVSVDIDDVRAIGSIVWGDSFARSPERCSAHKDARERERLESFAIPRTPLNQCGPASIATQSPRLRPPPLSIAGVMGEVSHQRVACFFPVASHSWMVLTPIVTEVEEIHR
jgi:hypothetical protein